MDFINANYLQKYNKLGIINIIKGIPHVPQLHKQ